MTTITRLEAAGATDALDQLVDLLEAEAPAARARAFLAARPPQSAIGSLSHRLTSSRPGGNRLDVANGSRIYVHTVRTAGDAEHARGLDLVALAIPAALDDDVVALLEYRLRRPAGQPGDLTVITIR